MLFRDVMLLKAIFYYARARLIRKRACDMATKIAKRSTTQHQEKAAA